MKKEFLMIIALISVQTLFAQNTPWSTTENIGIGTTTPLSPLHVQNNTVPTVRFYNTVRGEFGGAVGIFGTYWNGTGTVTGDRLGALNFAGNISTAGMTSSVSIAGFAEGTFSSSSLPASLRFYTIPANSVTLTERMRITPSGDVGIGTTSPLAPLQVNSTVVGAARFYSTVRGSNHGAALILGNYWDGTTTVNGDRLGGLHFSGTIGSNGVTSSAAIGGFAEGNFTTTSLPGSLRFFTIPTNSITLAERMRITSAGNVGIGTTDPASLLHVNAPTTFTPILSLGGQDITHPFTTFLGNKIGARVYAHGSMGGLIEQGFTDVDIAGVRIQGHLGVAAPTKPAIMLEGFKTDGSTGRAVMGNDEIVLMAGNGDLNVIPANAALTILGNGNVGIGTITPAARLHTTGTVRFDGLTNNNSFTRVLVSDGAGNIAYRDASTLGSGGSSSSWSYDGNTVGVIKKLGTTDNYALPIVTNNIERMRIGTNGNVGIGTYNISDAGYKLFVETGIRTRKVKVDQTNWPDYVFHANYQLPSLAEVEQYIQSNNHLPGVPSATEVAKDGLNLGDNQAVLLKKIEELTLYVIEQNKKQEQQNSKIAQQMAKNEEQQNEIEELKKELKKIK